MIKGSELVSQITILPDAVRVRAQETPRHEALVFGDWRISYAEFDQLVDQCAAALAEAGVMPGHRVATLSTPRPEFLISMLGAMRLGAIWVGLNSKYRLQELQHILQDSQPTLLFAINNGPDGRSYESDLQTLLRQTPSIQRSVIIGDHADLNQTSFMEFLHQTTVAPPPASVDKSRSKDAAVIVYTSGSTGKPKGALLSHNSFFHSYKAFAEAFAGHEHLRTAHRAICNLPINHVGCEADLCGNALIDGATIFFMETFDPGQMLPLIEKEKITLQGGVPLMIQAIFDHPDSGNYDLSSINAVMWGGAAMPRPFLEKISTRGVFLSLHYGLTEGGSVNSVSPPNADLDVLTQTIGHHDHDHEYRVMTSDGRAAAAGEVGEVQMRGPGVFLGYWQQPEATAAAFTADGWFKTGDLVEVLENGFWRFTGRSSEMFKSGGYNVYPREVELAIETCPGVAAAFVISVPDAKYDDVGWAYVIPDKGVALTTDDLKGHCAKHLANYKIPKRFFIRETVPMLPIGKVDKKALKIEALEIIS